MPSTRKKNVATVQGKKRLKTELGKAKSALNPFEVKVNRKKHDVLGQKSKSDRGLPGVARSKAVKKRKNTLLLEFKQRNRSNQFLDRRFGEYDESLTAEEKMMKRFVLERKRKHERSKGFSLEEDNEQGLTHYGQSIGDMERFDDIQLSEEEPDEGDLDETHFGGFLRRKRPRQSGTGEAPEDEETARPKSRKQILEEVVANSKALKFERQSEKKVVEDLLDEIDGQWKSIQSSIPKAVAGPQLQGVGNSSSSSRECDDYDKTVRELVFERRGKPTDRLKSEEELAREERERLDTLEADRVRRMKGVLPSEESLAREKHTSADSVGEKVVGKKHVAFTVRYEDGKMVLPDEQDVDLKELLSGRVIQGMEEGESSEGGEGSEDGESSEDGEDGESSEDGEGGESGSDGSGYESDLDSEDEPMDPQALPSLPEGVESASSAELPYVIDVPNDVEELHTLVHHRPAEECLTAVERIYSCNHPTLQPANKQKLEAFLCVLVDYCLSLCEQPTQEKLDVVNKLARPVFKLTQLNAHHTASLFQSLLRGIQADCLGRHKKHSYPSLSDLVVFKLVGVVFPASDFQHPVVTPAVLLMGALLCKCRVRSAVDLLHGLLLCGVMIEFVSVSKRFIPEVVNFLTSTLALFSSSSECLLHPPFLNKSGKLQSELSQFHRPSESSTTNFAELERPFTLLSEAQVWTEGCLSLENKAALLMLTLDLTRQASKLYAGLPSYPEIFSPVHFNLTRLASSESWPTQLKEMCTQLAEGVWEKSSVPRTVLQLLKQKPKSIKFYEPKFDQVYDVSRRKTRSKDTGERQKLGYKVKKERKGAIREIRKDTAFLAKEKLKETLQRDAERERKTKQIMHDLQSMQHEAKMERMMSKKR